MKFIYFVLKSKVGKKKGNLNHKSFLISFFIVQLTPKCTIFIYIYVYNIQCFSVQCKHKIMKLKNKRKLI